MNMPTIQQNPEAENVPPPKNNLVPSSELESAVEAMKAHLATWETQHSKTSRLDEDSRRVLVHLLEQAGTSVSSHLTRLVEKTSDQEYHSHVHPSHVEEENVDEGIADDDEDECLDDDSEDEFDEEELMDEEALQRARDLRQQLRESAERVSVLRSNVTDLAVSAGKQEVALLVGPPSRDPEPPHDADVLAKRLSEPFQGDKSAYLGEMEGSLQRLHSALKEMDVKLPDKIENLQETVEVIQNALKQGASLSQTEQAIRSRENEGPMMRETEVDENATAEKRLASFLGQY